MVNVNLDCIWQDTIYLPWSLNDKLVNSWIDFYSYFSKLRFFVPQLWWHKMMLKYLAKNTAK